MRRNASGHGNTRRGALKVNKLLSIDWVFIMQKYHDKERTERLAGINGEEAYLLISDHLTGKLWHVSSVSNKPTLNWINMCISCRTPQNLQNKYVAMDQGGEMTQNPEILSLFENMAIP